MGTEPSAEAITVNRISLRLWCFCYKCLEFNRKMLKRYDIHSLHALGPYKSTHCSKGNMTLDKTLRGPTPITVLATKQV